MIKCTMEDSCEKGKLCCCCECEEKKSCDVICTNLDNVANCGYAEMDETAALAVFETQQVAVLNSIADLIQAKKNLEAKEADLKVKLQDAMETYGIKKFTSDILDITYVAATKAESIDSTKLKGKYPQIAAECVKVSNRKAYIKVALKGGYHLHAEEQYRKRVSMNLDRIQYAIQQLEANGIEYVLKNDSIGHFHCRQKSTDKLFQFWAGTGKILGFQNLRGIHNLINILNK